MSTSVPSRGRARRRLFEGDFTGRKQALYAVSDVAAGEGGTADVGDVAVELERGVGLFPGELRAPARIADFVAVGLAVFHDLDAVHRPRRVDPQPIRDEVVLAEHLV